MKTKKKFNQNLYVYTIYIHLVYILNKNEYPQ